MNEKDHEALPSPDTPTGREPTLSNGLSGHEPVLGGDLREWPSIVVHLLADQHQAQRDGEWKHVRVIRQLRTRIWREADEANWQHAQRDNLMTGNVHLSRWRDVDEAVKAYQRPVYDKIQDEVALKAMEAERGETQAALDQARRAGRDDLVRDLTETMTIIDSYIDWWRERLG